MTVAYLGGYRSFKITTIQQAFIVAPTPYTITPPSGKRVILLSYVPKIENTGFSSTTGYITIGGNTISGIGYQSVQDTRAINNYFTVGNYRSSCADMLVGNVDEVVTIRAAGSSPNQAYISWTYGEE